MFTSFLYFIGVHCVSRSVHCVHNLRPVHFTLYITNFDFDITIILLNRKPSARTPNQHLTTQLHLVLPLPLTSPLRNQRLICPVTSGRCWTPLLRTCLYVSGYMTTPAPAPRPLLCILYLPNGWCVVHRTFWLALGKWACGARKCWVAGFP